MPVLSGAYQSPVSPTNTNKNTTTNNNRSINMTCFGQFLCNHKLATSFASYMHSIYAEEEMEFWLDVELFKYDNTRRSKRQIAIEIYDKYLSTSSPQPIHVDDDILQEVAIVISLFCHTAAGSTSNCDLTIFDKAQDAVESVLVNDCVLRFKEVLKNNTTNLSQCPPSLTSKLHRYYKVKAHNDAPICKAHSDVRYSQTITSQETISSQQTISSPQIPSSLWSSLISTIFPSHNPTNPLQYSPPTSPRIPPKSAPLPTKSYTQLPPPISLSPPPSPPKIEIQKPFSSSPRPLSVIIPNSPPNSPPTSPRNLLTIPTNSNTFSSSAPTTSYIPQGLFHRRLSVHKRGPSSSTLNEPSIPTPISPVSPPIADVITGFVVATPSSSSPTSVSPDSSSDQKLTSSYSSASISPQSSVSTPPVFSYPSATFFVSSHPSPSPVDIHINNNSNNSNTSSGGFMLAMHRSTSTNNFNYSPSLTPVSSSNSTTGGSSN